MNLLVLRRPSRPSRHDRGLAYGSRAGCGGPEEKEVGLGVSVPVSRVWTPHDLKKQKKQYYPARDERCGACHTGVDCSGHLLDTFSSLKCTTNRSLRASRPRSRPRSASRAPRRPRAGLPSFGDTSDAISRQPLRVGRVDRCWCQWHGGTGGARPAAGQA